jgi:hypothetical protein
MKFGFDDSLDVVEANAVVQSGFPKFLSGFNSTEELYDFWDAGNAADGSTSAFEPDCSTKR